MAHAVEDLTALLHHLDIDRTALLGYSLGGRVALHFAVEAPQLLWALVIESASPGIEDDMERDARFGSDAQLAASIESDGIEAFVDRWQAQPLFASQRSCPPTCSSEQRRQRLDNSALGLANSLRGMGAGAQRWLLPELPQSDVPTLFLAGALDERYAATGARHGRRRPRTPSITSSKAPATRRTWSSRSRTPPSSAISSPATAPTKQKGNSDARPDREHNHDQARRRMAAEGDYEDILYARPPTASPRSRSTAPRCATPSGPRPSSSCRTPSCAPTRTTAVGVIILTGAGDKAFCSGGDQKVRGHGGYVGDDGVPRLNVLELQRQIRTLPKPVVAMVAGYAIGGGHVLHIVCDLTIAADNAIFGQTGPKVGSFDAGYGATLLARIVGHKKAREIWYLCRQYDAQQALEMGLVNTVVPLERLEEETVAWCREMLAMSPRRCDSSRPRSTPTRTAWPASSSSPATPRCSTT